MASFFHLSKVLTTRICEVFPRFLGRAGNDDGAGTPFRMFRSSWSLEDIPRSPLAGDSNFGPDDLVIVVIMPRNRKKTHQKSSRSN